MDSDYHGGGLLARTGRKSTGTAEKYEWYESEIDDEFEPTVAARRHIPG
jgi:hypothetical protein